jgi:N-acetylglutamate synthase-like GNAT family acetyltransferase
VTTRLLPRDEWPKLAGTELETVVTILPDSAAVIVVEDAGVIVGCWSLLPVYHAEGIWIRPDYRRQGGVALRLLRGLRTVAKRYGARAVCTASMDTTVSTLIERIGGQKMPGTHYTVPMGV